jgi:Concanavalin A-like lectin/glucanases superfamily
MLKALSAFLFTLGLWCIAQAQVPLTHAGLGAPSSGYQGPGDVVSGALAWWGVRCYNTAYAGNVMDITDTSTGNTTGTRLQCSSGGTVSALVSGSACTFVTGNACSTLATTCATSCNVEKLYDQSGNTNCSSAACDLSQATNATRPTLNTNCVNGKICLVWSASTTQYLSNASQYTTTQPFSVSAYVQRTQNNTTQQIFFSCSGGASQAGFSPSTNSIYMFSGSAQPTATASDGSFHALQLVFNNASSTFYVDGSSTSASLTSSTGCANVNSIFLGVASGGVSATKMEGELTEEGVWASGFNSTQAGSMTTNQANFY